MKRIACSMALLSLLVLVCSVDACGRGRGGRGASCGSSGGGCGAGGGGGSGSYGGGGCASGNCGGMSMGSYEQPAQVAKVVYDNGQPQVVKAGWNWLNSHSAYYWWDGRAWTTRSYLNSDQYAVWTGNSWTEAMPWKEYVAYRQGRRGDERGTNLVAR